MLQRLGRDAAFRKFVKLASQAYPRCALPSLLIKPIQRLPRYVMLLETLLKYTPSVRFFLKNYYYSEKVFFLCLLLFWFAFFQTIESP